MKFNKFFLADTETEGLSLSHSRPWQVAYVYFDHKGVLERREEYIWWEDLDISEGAARATRFDYNKYKSLAKDPLEVLESILPFLEDEKNAIVGHNFLCYDAYVIKTWKKALGIKEDWKYLDRVIDTHLLAKGAKLDNKPDFENFLAWQYKMNSERAKIKTSLATMAKEYDIPYDATRAHDALYDVELNMHVFNKMKYVFPS